jgi:hypothetical protein
LKKGQKSRDGRDSGQIGRQRLDTEDSVFNRVARDLCVDMRYHWHPDRSFLERCTRNQLVAIAVDCGYAENTGRVSSYKKAELVNSLLWYFETARAANPGAGEGPRMVAGRDAVSRREFRRQCRRGGRGERGCALGGCGLTHLDAAALGAAALPLR